MDIGVAEARNRLSELIRAVEAGEEVVITRNGTAVAQLGPAPRPRARVRLEEMKDRIQMPPVWNEPVDLERFLAASSADS